MVKYMGETQLDSIRECGALLRSMMQDIGRELLENDYRNFLPEVARNAQIVEKSTNSLWFITASIGGSSEGASITEYASSIPDKDTLGTFLYYGSEVEEEVSSGHRVQVFAVAKCAGEIPKVNPFTKLLDELVSFGKDAYDIYKILKASLPGHRLSASDIAALKRQGIKGPFEKLFGL
ncbi:hypothetical protein C4K03_5853 [Pseudomonas synxantha]|uniref:Uncharacterized protein n=1 Tax=Pseudomonas synxantha TaxID=47883 RepID=A0A3G7UEV5_9PSED|nr:hypothetical protein [Pseudomonas synxantha]AZE57960.1 hypothetical protein C4K03_5853 [Pseudomonas synxantha]